jgi:hypothetical protein
MFKPHIVQALNGYCFILEYGTVQVPRYILIDGGPQRDHEENLQPVLQGIAAQGGGLDYAILRRLGEDFVLGHLDLLEEIQYQRDSAMLETTAMGEICLKAFCEMLGVNVETRRSLWEERHNPLDLACDLCSPICYQPARSSSAGGDG